MKEDIKVPEEARVDEVADKYYQKILQTVEDGGDFETTKKSISQYMAKNGVSSSGTWHYAQGMKDVQRLDPKNERVPLNTLLISRAMAYALACMELGETPTETEKELIGETEGINACEVFVLPNDDMIYLEMPIKHSIVCDHIDGNMKLHNEEGPAIEFRDGSRLYALDDVSGVPAWVVKTHADNISPRDVLSLEDVDHRRVAIQKIGLDRMAEGAEIVDESQGRTLYNMRHLFGRDAKYLKMVNPSLKQVHMEGVPNHCETVQEARNERASRNSKVDFEDWNPLIIDGYTQDAGIDGQYQHGDVCLMRVDAPATGEVLSQSVLLDAKSRHRFSAGELRGDERNQFLTVKQSASLTHPEHDTITLPEGVYALWRISEWDWVNDIVRDLID